MKSLAISEKYGLQRYVAHQAYYSLIGREYEWELMPLAIDQNIEEKGGQKVVVGDKHLVCSSHSKPPG